MVALSLSLRETAEEDCPKLVQVSGPSGRRRQLHILYLLSDILHHTKFHIESSSAYLIWTNNIQVYLVDLFGAASAYSFERFAKHHKKIQDLLQIWKEKGYYQPSDIEKLRDTVRSAARLGYPSTGEDLKRPQEPPSEEKKDVPYLMPASHGDSSTPFYDLPAGNMMPHIKPNSSRTINPQNVKPLQFTAGPAEQKLVIAVKEFLAKVESMDSVGFGNEGIAMDIDELGQWTTHDEIAGVVTDGEGYYGWSRAFCENMKRRSDGIGGLERAVARDGSIERSLSPRKRRRYSDSGNSRNGEYNRQNVSSSRDASRQRMNRRSYSRSRSTSREPRQSRSFRSRSCTRSRSSSYSPPQSLAAFQPPAKHDTSPPPEAPGPPPPPPFPFLLPFSQGFPLGPGGIPVPPPPPPNYSMSFQSHFSPMQTMFRFMRDRLGARAPNRFLLNPRLVLGLIHLFTNAHADLETTYRRCLASTTSTLRYG